MRGLALLVSTCAAVAWLVAAPAAQTPDEALARRAAEGAAALEAGRFDEAAAIYGEVVAKRPADPGLLMNLGMARYMSGDPAGALEPLEQAAARQPSLAPASLFLGSALVDLGRPADALAPLKHAVAAMPDNPDARQMLAQAYVALEKYPEAAGEYRVLTRLAPESPTAWYSLARSYEGIAEGALDALQASAADSPLLELLVADVAVTQDKFAGALAIYRRVMADPPVGGLHEAVADLYARAGHPDWAAAERAKAPARPEGPCTTKPAECNFLAGRYAESLKAALRSTTPAGRYWAIRAANQLATEAVGRLEGLPASVELHLVRADIAQSRGQNPDAVREVKAALALSPGDPRIESALAEALLHAHDLDEAVPLIERLNRQAPDDPALLLMLGDALLEQQQIDRAIPVLERAAAVPHPLPHASASLGRAYVQAGRYAEALPRLEAAARTDPTADVFLQLARTYQALQRPEDARTAMTEYQRRTAASAPEGPEAAPEPELTPPE